MAEPTPVYRPTPEEVDLLLTGLDRLLDKIEADAAFDPDLFDEVQAELDRLHSIDALTETHAERAVALLYRWNDATHRDALRPFSSAGMAPGLYFDPTGRYRKRYWTGSAWGPGVGVPKDD